MTPIKYRAFCDGKMYYNVIAVADDCILEILGTDKTHLSDRYRAVHVPTPGGVMQSTGLADKHGKEIYGEGDIYKDANGIISVVKMAVDGWALFPIKKGTPVRNLYWHNVCCKTKGEVIGNIHENPELLE